MDWDWEWGEFPREQQRDDFQKVSENKTRTDVYFSPLSLPHPCPLVQSHAMTEAWICRKLWCCGDLGIGRRWDVAQDRNWKWEQPVSSMLVDRPSNNLALLCLPLLILEPFTSIPLQLWPYSRIYHKEHFCHLKKHSLTFYVYLCSLCSQYAI